MQNFTIISFVDLIKNDEALEKQVSLVKSIDELLEISESNKLPFTCEEWKQFCSLEENLSKLKASPMEGYSDISVTSVSSIDYIKELNPRLLEF